MKNKISRRLDSIKAAHESEKAISSRVEDYLEVISELVDMKGYAATLDISRYMNVSAPSVTKMLKKLDADGYLIYEKYYGINLTGEGQRIADIIKQKHGILLEFFEILGITHFHIRSFLDNFRKFIKNYFSLIKIFTKKLHMQIYIRS